MREPTAPYSIPEGIEPELRLVCDYWETLKRGENEMPFWDDVKPTALPDMSNRLMLINAFANPQRFRFGVVGQDIEHRYGKAMRAMFIDEAERRAPLQYLNSQCSATVEGRRPTYYQHVSSQTQRDKAPESYSRLLLPLWGDGHISMLLGAVVWR